MINSEVKENLKIRLIEGREKRLEIKEKYSLRILVFFTNGIDTPETIKERNNSKEYIEIEQEKGTHIIYAAPSDFHQERLRSDSEIQKKYIKFREIDNGSKILLLGHGHAEEPTIWVSGDYIFTTRQVVSIFELIQNPLVQVPLEEFKKLKSLPKKHLHVSILLCHAENFARHLSEELEVQTSPDKRWFLSITAGKIDRTMSLKARGYKNVYTSLCTKRIDKITYCLMWILGLAMTALSIAIPIEGALFENDEKATKLSFAAIPIGALFFLSLAINILLKINVKKNDASNSKHKIVISTNFKKDSEDYFTTLSKDRFKKLQSVGEFNSGSSAESVGESKAGASKFCLRFQT